MNPLRYFILYNESDVLSAKVCFVSNINNEIKVENNSDEIKKMLHKFIRDSIPTFLRVQVKTKDLKEDLPFKILFDHLPLNINIQKLDCTENHVYKLKQKTPKIIFVVNEEEWEEKKRECETVNDIHLADEKHIDVMRGVYQLSNKLPIEKFSHLKVEHFLPNNCLHTFKKFHLIPNKYQTIQWHTEKRKVYKIRNYPQCIWTKLCPKMPALLVRLWMNKVVGLMTVMYYVNDNFQSKIDSKNESAITLNWKEGTFLSNKTYTDSSKYELLCEINEPHLTCRWGKPSCCSVVGESDMIYYLCNQLETDGCNYLSKHGMLFVKKMLMSRKWYKDEIQSKSNFEFVKSVYEQLFETSIYYALDPFIDGNDDDDFITNLLNKLIKYVIIVNNEPELCFCFKDEKGKIRSVKYLSVSAFFELFSSDIPKGLNVVADGFLCSIEKYLFVPAGL